MLTTLLLSLSPAPPQEPIALGTRRELFVDRHLIEQLDDAQLTLHPPHDEGVVLRFDQPWEGGFSGYATVLRDGDLYRMYYRGRPLGSKDNGPQEVTCVAESSDGSTWTKPSLGLFELDGSSDNNVVLADAAPTTHNFCPLLDTRPGVPADERYKALGGNEHSGLIAYASADGLRWRKLSDEGVLRDGKFDSQNVAFWSEHEGQYVCYFRTWSGGGWNGYRTISRATSADFLHWSEAAPMTFGDRPNEHLYTNQTGPYFRAPHLYVATPARFFPGRRVLSAEQAGQLGVDPGYFSDCSDGVLMTSRGGTSYQRTFMEGFIRPGIGLSNWVSRTNYPALGIVQTGPEEMSLYVQHDYAQDSAHVRRYSMRLDGLASVRAGYGGGELLTRPLTFSGDRLLLNFATSAAGELRVELQDLAGQALPGFALADCDALIGNALEREVRWAGDLASLKGRPVRLRVTLKDADLFALRFAPAPPAGHRVALQGNGKLAIVDAAGAIEWELPWGGIHDLHVLESGNLMVQRGSREVVEIDVETKQVVWSYDSSKRNGNEGKPVEVHAFQPLPNGRVMIAESGPARIIEIDRDGKLLHQIPLRVEHPHPHMDTRLVRKLASGNYLVCHEGDGAVREYEGQTGAVVWDYPVPMFGQETRGGHGPEAFGNKCFGAVRLANGNTLIATGNGHSVIEVTPDRRVVWQLGQSELPGITLAWVTTLEVLPNGHYVIGNCHAGPGQPLLIELDPASKEVLWTFDQYDVFGNSVPNSQLLDVGKSIR